MKTLKQIREEYNAKSLDRLESAPDELMLEGRESGRKISRASPIPSSKEMPVMLIFRRMQYKVFPNNQVVALYYSNMVNKYLSIPFGKDGNLNLSEAVISDTIDEGIGSALDTAADYVVPYYSAGKKALKGDLSGAAKDAAVDTALMAVGGPVAKLGGAALRGAAKIGSKIASRVGTKAVPRTMDRALFTGGAKVAASTGAKTAARTAAKSAIRSVAKGAVDALTSGGEKTPTGTTLGQNRPTPSGVKGKTSWEKARPRYNATTQSKLAQADIAQSKKASQKQVDENKISDIRAMIESGKSLHEMNINGIFITLNNSMAKRILEVYDSVNTKNKKIVESMLNEDLESFKKLLNFSIRN